MNNYVSFFSATVIRCPDKNRGPSWRRRHGGRQGRYSGNSRKLADHVAATLASRENKWGRL